MLPVQAVSARRWRVVGFFFFFRKTDPGISPRCLPSRLSPAGVLLEVRDERLDVLPLPVRVQRRLVQAHPEVLHSPVLQRLPKEAREEEGQPLTNKTVIHLISQD